MGIGFLVYLGRQPWACLSGRATVQQQQKCTAYSSSVALATSPTHGGSIREPCETPLNLLILISDCIWMLWTGCVASVCTFDYQRYPGEISFGHHQTLGRLPFHAKLCLCFVDGRWLCLRTSGKSCKELLEVSRTGYARRPRWVHCEQYAKLFVFERVPHPETCREGRYLFTALALRQVKSSEDKQQPQSVQCVCMQ